MKIKNAPGEEGRLFLFLFTHEIKFSPASGRRKIASQAVEEREEKEQGKW